MTRLSEVECTKRVATEVSGFSRIFVVQGEMKASAQFGASVGFFEELDMAKGPKFVGKGFFSEAGGEKQSDLWVDGKGEVGEFDTIHAAG